MAHLRVGRSGPAIVARRGDLGEEVTNRSSPSAPMPFKCLPDCGKCCIMVPIPKQVFLKHRDNCQVEPVAVRDIGTEVVPDTEDHRCAFLNRETKQCTIYDDRPEMCRRFGTEDSPDLVCSYVRPTGQPRSRAERRRIQRDTVRGMEKLLSMKPPLR